MTILYLQLSFEGCDEAVTPCNWVIRRELFLHPPCVRVAYITQYFVMNKLDIFLGGKFCEQNFERIWLAELFWVKILWGGFGGDVLNGFGGWGLPHPS